MLRNIHLFKKQSIFFRICQKIEVFTRSSFTLEKSKHKINKVKKIYTSMASPSVVKGFSLDLYHCFSQVEDGINELERYTMGYVDNYLHDGKAMIKEARKKRKLLQNQKKDWMIL